MPVRVRGTRGLLGGTERVSRMVRAGRKAGDLRNSGRAASARIRTLDPRDPPDPRLARSARGPLTVPEPSSGRPAAWWYHGG